MKQVFEKFVDWDNAPEGATHYNDADCIEPWLKMDSTGKWYYNTDAEKWKMYDSGWDYHFDNAIKRPVAEEKKEMNEWKYSLPPVGTEFEYSFGGNYWFKATSTYVVGDSGVVALCGTMESVVEQYLDNEECEFRPIKSKEQQEKEEAIAEMVKVADPMWESQIKAEAMCKRLFDAGWRKVE